MGLYLIAGAVVATLLVLQKWLEFRKAEKAIGHLPGFRLLLAPWLPIPLPWKYIPGVYRRGGRAWQEKFAPFARVGRDCLGQVVVLPRVHPFITFADPMTVKEINMSRARFPKPVALYRALCVYGPNIVASEGDLWKRLRKPVAPAFNERNYNYVWDETVKIVLGMFETTTWKDKNEVVVDHCVDITLPIALMVLGVAAFGRKLTWEDDNAIPPGHQMSFKDALNTSSVNIFTKVFIPRWMSRFRYKWRRTMIAFDELHNYMKEIIEMRRNATEKAEHYDLFSGLLAESTESEDQLSDSELIGNTFIFMIAGHETTAHTLAFTFGLLAIYQDIQEKLYEHIISITGGTRIPTYDEYSKFNYALGVFNETMRLYPPVNSVSKYAAEDTVLTVTRTNPDGTYSPEQIVAGKGTTLNVNILGMHYNPRYWDEPYEFRPERFLKSDWPRDAFLPFSSGPRACIGRKFFETEGIAIMITLLSHYKIKLPDTPEWTGLDAFAKREKLLQCRPVLTLTPTHVPLVFEKRVKA